jgi:hypothetical protein
MTVKVVVATKQIIVLRAVILAAFRTVDILLLAQVASAGLTALVPRLPKYQISRRKATARQFPRPRLPNLRPDRLARSKRLHRPQC